MMARSWLKKLCMPAESPGGNINWIHYVQCIRDDESIFGNVWSLASNAKGLFMLKDGGKQYKIERDRDPTMTKMLPKSKSENSTKMFLQASIDVPRTINLGDLRLWLGPRVREKCPRCKGSPVSMEDDASHRELYCDFCDGDGWVEPKRIPVQLWPKSDYYDPQLLAKYLPKAVGKGYATFGKMAGTKSLALLVDGRMERDGESYDWRSVIMPMVIETIPPDDLSKAPRYYPGIGEVWHLRSGPDRGILRDWCDEREVNLDQLEGVLPF